MKILLVLAAVAFVVIYCIKFAARLVEAKSGTGSILLCLLVQAGLSELSRHIGLESTNVLVQFVAAFAGGALVYSLVLDTTFKKGIIISLLSSGLIVIGMVLIFATAAIGSSGGDVEQASLQEMEGSNAESVARDRGYADTAYQAMMGDGSDMRACLSKSGPPENFVIYLEVLPDGSAGKSRLQPVTDVGECFLAVADKRHYPAPPGAHAYVTKNTMVFQHR